ncbi:uncharacterized protein PHACADRAFT_261499 [Phanerochaete carnosa HHB-10118-sp]|uniref:Uncharacterized protein n=1 Tax=Phanerochaete carnosa (strain HHB-10118-sp) TaxID=650164 RepID=K5W190_PHACS|nr:uncharacterized protein PHACADRAFT_261499 [Phanerochaete carnosa HHB-10118-sp]EKM52845.1 hypothetical protein PHACADRAFT_261499 [Phanerochaete carnosa HHB-10118-sp]
MSPSAGAELPSEILSSILNHIMPDLNDYDYSGHEKCRLLKHELVAPSLVCKYWTEAIRPFLFRRLILRSAEDVQFLKRIVYNPQFPTSSLSGAIERIDIYQQTTKTKPWLHHVHGLSARLRQTVFMCTIDSRSEDTASPVGRWTPLDSTPSVTPSYVPLSVLVLNGLVFTSTTELARLVDSFATLVNCYFDGLTFLDSLPIVQSRRSRRRFSSALDECEISRCKEIDLSAQASLACDLLVAAARLGLEDHPWSAVLQALFTLVPSTFNGAFVRLRDRRGRMFDNATIDCFSPAQGDSAGNSIEAEVEVRRPSASRDAEAPVAYIEKVTLRLSFTDAEVVDLLPWDVLRTVIDSPLLHCLRIESRWRQDDEGYETTRRILCSVLCRTQLPWALESGKLQFGHHHPDKSVTSADILSVPTEHTVDDTTITLDAAEQAEYLLRIFHPDGREKYLRELASARRTSVASAHGTSATAPSTARGTQGITNVQVQPERAEEASEQGGEDGTGADREDDQVGTGIES